MLGHELANAMDGLNNVRQHMRFVVTYRVVINHDMCTGQLGLTRLRMMTESNMKMT